MGLDVWEFRTDNNSSGFPIGRLGIQHRYIVGETQDIHWQYKIEVDGANGDLYGPSIHEVTFIHKYMGDVLAERNHVLMKHVKTDPEVDEALFSYALDLKDTPWTYSFLDNDCGTFANRWLDLARTMQKGEDFDSLLEGIEGNNVNNKWEYASKITWLWFPLNTK